MLLALGLGLLPGLVVAQGLGGAARQAAERRAVAGDGAEVRRYTDADLGTDSGGDEGEDPAVDTAAGEVVATEARAASGGLADGESVDRLREELDRAAARRKESERTWRQRSAGARAKLAAARKEHDVACNPHSIALRGG